MSCIVQETELADENVIREMVVFNVGNVLHCSIRPPKNVQTLKTSILVNNKSAGKFVELSVLGLKWAFNILFRVGEVA